MKNWLLRAALVAAIIGLVWLYVREFPVFDNTIGIGRLAFSAIGAAVGASAVALFFLRKKLSSMEDKLPFIFTVLMAPALFAPLFGSLANRLRVSETAERSFLFQKEEAFRMSRFGFLAMLQKESPTGWHLFVKDPQTGKPYRFRYQKQPYFPLTKPGEVVLLPVREGRLGFPVVELE